MRDWRSCFRIATAVCAVGAIAGPGRAGTLHVPGQIATIQGAIIASAPGDTVLVEPGTYFERLDFLGKAITVVSSGGATVTIVTAIGTGSTVTFADKEGPGSVLQGFTITGGTGSPGPIDAAGTIDLVGGGVKIIAAQPRLVDLVITANSSHFGAGVYAWAPPTSQATSASLEGCTIVDNTAANSGGGVSTRFAPMSLLNCKLLDNVAGVAGGGLFAGGSDLWMTYVGIDANLAGIGGGIRFESGPGPGGVGHLWVTAGSLSGNAASISGGGISTEIQPSDVPVSSGAAEILALRIVGNGAPKGAAVEDQSSAGWIHFTSCLVAGNESSGSAVMELSGQASVLGCTVIENPGPGIAGTGAMPSVQDSIVRGNAAPQLENAVATWSDVEGGWLGLGNIDVDPQFVAPGVGDDHLQPGSPCHDAGDPAASYFQSDVDLDVEPRIQGGRVDMGCDEVFTDCNGNGVADPLDIKAHTSTDCDGNGIPDECEPFVDCNGNGQQDACDIALHESSDCNHDGVPDECEPFVDCDGDGWNDACEIAAGPIAGSPDCNGNGVPDACDIASGTSLDLEGNGIPDECQSVLLVPAQYPTIEAAILAASPGDTIALADGVYSGTGNVALDFHGRVVTLASLHGAEACIIDAQGQSRIASLGSSEKHGVILRGLTLRNGLGNSGGALLCEDGAVLEARDCVFEACIGLASGGAATVRNGASATFIGCVFTGNQALKAPALRVNGAHATLERCTVVGNPPVSVASSGAINANQGATLDVRDSILRDNGADGSPQLHMQDSGTVVTASFSDVEGGLAGVDTDGLGLLAWGDGMLEADPLFKDEPAADFRLKGGSPCIDSGDPSAPPDADGTPADMGALPFEGWTNLGAALAGALGAPGLAGTGVLLPAQQTVLTLSSARPASALWLVAGAAEIDAPFKGGILVPAVDLLLPQQAVGADGTAVIDGRWPVGVPSGFVIYLQAWIADSSGPLGFTASNALSAEAR